MTQAVLRQATLDDIAILVPFIRAYYDFDGIAFKSTEIRQSLATLLGNPSLGRVWMAYLDKEPAGYVIATFGYDLEFGGLIATVTELFVASRHRRRGLGTQMLAGVEGACRDLGVRALELQVEQKNVEAQAFYRRLGFVVHRRIPLSKCLESLWTAAC